MSKKVTVFHVPLPAFLRDAIRNSEELSDDLLQELLHAAKNGSVVARNRVIEVHLPLIYRSVTHRARQLCVPKAMVEDMFQHVSIFTVRSAIRRYDPSKGMRFSTYLHWWIQSAVKQYRHSHEEAVRTSQTSTVGRKAWRRIASFDQPLTNDSPRTLHETMHEDADAHERAIERLDATLRADALRTAMSDLPERYRVTLELQYFKEWPREKIGAHVPNGDGGIGIAPTAVSEAHRNGKRKLRGKLQKHYLFRKSA